jgi:hypothetical protein
MDGLVSDLKNFLDVLGLEKVHLLESPSGVPWAIILPPAIPNASRPSPLPILPAHSQGPSHVLPAGQLEETGCGRYG